MSDYTKKESQIRLKTQEIFRSASDSYKELIRQILAEERDVMHLKRRSDIHQRIYEHVKRVIK